MTQVLTGLPDDMFSYQNSQFGYILEGLGMENVSVLKGNWECLGNDNLVCFTAILYFCGYLVYFFAFFGMFY
jgi:hypothetical protein